MPHSVQEPDRAPAALSEQIKKCLELCKVAEENVAQLPAERGSFLASSLGDALGQLEVILRAVRRESSETSRKQDRQGLLRFLFGKGDNGAGHPFDPPKFASGQHGLQGNSLSISMGELLGFLAYGKKTGVLWIDTPEENYILGLVDGKVMHAASDHTPEGMRLGEVLVGLGCLTRRQLERFLTQKVEAETTISGEVLVKSGTISDEELHTALRLQVQQLVKRVIQTKSALFRFREAMEIPLAYKVSLDVNQLLIESAREQDEQSNATLRKDMAQETWNSWQEGLSAEIAEATGAPLPTKSAADDKGSHAAKGKASAKK